MDVYKDGDTSGCRWWGREGGARGPPERWWGRPYPGFSPAPARLSPAPHLHPAELLHRLLLALPRRRDLSLQLLQLRLQLLAGSHRQSALLAFLVPLHLCIPQLGWGGGRGELRAQEAQAPCTCQ